MFDHERYRRDHFEVIKVITQLLTVRRVWN
ncbi:hypothetical protein JOD27_006350 [Lentzea nigeriaca]|nr:hypothetical protein [Lentzea nigeriaca]